LAGVYVAHILPPMAKTGMAPVQVKISPAL